MNSGWRIWNALPWPPATARAPTAILAEHVYLVMADDPDNAHGAGDDADLILARSTDHGQTWTCSTLESRPNSSFQRFSTMNSSLIATSLRRSHVKVLLSSL